jgi:signal transduction histidine kinase
VTAAPASRRVSAALALSVAAGCLAAVAVLPLVLSLAIQLRVVASEQSSERVAVAARVVGATLRDGRDPPPGIAALLGVSHVQVRDAAGHASFDDGVGQREAWSEVRCDARGPVAVDVGGTSWVAVCEEIGDRRVVAGVRQGADSLVRVFSLFGTLTVVVGIVTALGVLRLLTPLSRVSEAMTRVGAGERGVRLRTTGLRELDDLVDRVNAAASAVEVREENILSRIKSAQEMARMVAHEVRNPLQSLELLVSLIVSEEDPVEREALAASIRAEIHGLDLVVHRVLRDGVARGASGLRLERVRQSVGPIVEHILKLRVPDAARSGVRLERGVIEPVVASVDGALLGRCVENLVINAVQATNGVGGRVVVSVRAFAEGVRFVVEDNGRGVDPALGEHVFDVDVSGRPGGTGLGLAVVKQIVDLHGGRVFFERALLGGAAFVIEIPAEPMIDAAPR